MSYDTPRLRTAVTDNGYNSTWYDSCACCPYGYHIDLDFVRYCESVSQEAERTGSIKRRKDRRRQRQSMEVLLGITPPVLAVLEQNYKAIQEQQETPKIIQKQTTTSAGLFPIIQDGFDDAVSDFERTLQRSKNKLSNNLPDVTAVSENIKRVPSNSSMSSASGSGSSITVHPEATDGIITTTTNNRDRDFDTVSIESYSGLSPLALQNIREQMALSLERTKLLEDQVKLIPTLKDQLSSLKEENRRLQHRIEIEESSRLNTINANYIHEFPPNRMKSLSFTNIESIDGKRELPPPPPPRKDFGVMCGVLTRNVGVGHQNPNTKSVSTTTTVNGDFTNKWHNEKMTKQNLNNQYYIDDIDHSASKCTQTSVKEIRVVASQTVDKPKMEIIKISGGTQTTEKKKLLSHASVWAQPQRADFSCQKIVESFNVGVSDDTVSDIICDKCNVLKFSVGIGPETNEDSHTIPVSLAHLMGPRSKSFNLGEDKINYAARSRTVACQYEPTGVPKSSQSEPVPGLSKSCQSEIKTMSRACQQDIKITHKNTQYEWESISKNTDTKDLTTPTRSVACEAKEQRSDKSDVGCNTVPPAEADNTTNKIVACVKCANREKEENVKKDSSPTPSRIPRPQIPTTPVENRKFRRQDTYTKIYQAPGERSPTSSFQGLSGLDLSSKSLTADLTGPLEKVNQSFKLPDTSSPSSGAQNGASSIPPPTKVQIQETTLPLPETALLNPSAQTQRKKAVPSKEMRGAMKVLNDSLQKSQTKNLRNQNAINIIQQEWFKISSLVTANPLDVEDYLDAFEDVSSLLLEYIVNMTDDSGNTAMHYAVSHGNFDVVSILLDSKVCDINKPNKAGYTSVMLVSLAEIRSQTHANVVKRLFQLSDVNIRAKQSTLMDDYKRCLFLYDIWPTLRNTNFSMHGQTALMLAVSQGRLDMVKMLLEAGADINIQDEDGSTALMCAAEHGHIDIIMHFLSQPDCDTTITDVDGSTALNIAVDAGHKHIGVLLYTHYRNYQMIHGNKARKSKTASPKTPSSPLPIRSSHRALTDTKSTK